MKNLVNDFYDLNFEYLQSMGLALHKEAYFTPFLNGTITTFQILTNEIVNLKSKDVIEKNINFDISIGLLTNLVEELTYYLFPQFTKRSDSTMIQNKFEFYFNILNKANKNNLEEKKDIFKYIFYSGALKCAYYILDRNPVIDLYKSLEEIIENFSDNINIIKSHINET